ncbi:hypothetical protein BH23GEM2_BH23GEM2_11770 [soil metagenome]
MYRGGTVRSLPDWFLTMPTFDWPLHVLHAEPGDIGYLDEVLSAHRVHRGGFWSTGMSRLRTVEEIKTLIQAYETLNRHLDYRFNPAARRRQASLYNRSAEACMRMGRHDDALRDALRAFRLARFRSPKQRRAVRLVARALLGRLTPVS